MSSSNSPSLQEVRIARDLQEAVKTYHRQKLTTPAYAHPEVLNAIPQLTANASDGLIQRVDFDRNNNRIYVDIQLPVPVKEVPSSHPNPEYRYIVPDTDIFNRLKSKVVSEVKAKLTQTSCVTPKWFIHEDGENCLTRKPIHSYLQRFIGYCNFVRRESAIKYPIRNSARQTVDMIPVIVVGDRRYIAPASADPTSNSDVLWRLSYHFQEMEVLNKSRASITEALHVLLSLREDTGCPEYQTLQQLGRQVYITAAAHLYSDLHFWERAPETDVCVKQILGLIRDVTSDALEEKLREADDAGVERLAGVVLERLAGVVSRSDQERADEDGTAGRLHLANRHRRDRNPAVLSHFCNPDINLLEGYSKQDLQYVHQRFCDILECDEKTLKLFRTVKYAPQKPYKDSCPVS